MDGTNKKSGATPPPFPVGVNGRTRAVPAPPVTAARQSTPELVKEITREVKDLARKQIDLAIAEARADLRREITAVVGLGVGAVGAIVTVTLLLVTAAFALAKVMPAWGAGLVVSAAAGLATAIVILFGWHKRVRAPLERTRHALQQDARLVKEGGA